MPCFYHSQEDMLTRKKASDIIFDASLTSLGVYYRKKLKFFCQVYLWIFKILLPVASLNENF